MTVSQSPRICRAATLGKTHSSRRMLTIASRNSVHTWTDNGYFELGPDIYDYFNT